VSFLLRFSFSATSFSTPFLILNTIPYSLIHHTNRVSPSQLHYFNFRTSFC
jgi:hypothetical protein